MLYAPPIVMKDDGFTPDWDRILAPPILRKQTIHVRRSEVQMGADVYGSVNKTTLTTGAGLMQPLAVYLPKMVDPIICALEYLPPRYAHKRMLVRLNDVYAPTPYPVLTKARTPGDEAAVLLPIDYQRYFNPEYLRLIHQHADPEGADDAANNLDIPFHEKEPRAVRACAMRRGWCSPINQRKIVIFTLMYPCTFNAGMARRPQRRGVAARGAGARQHPTKFARAVGPRQQWPGGRGPDLRAGGGAAAGG